jgi:hypothetical protein
MVSATHADDVALVNRRAGLTFEHVAEVFPGEMAAS